MAAILLHKKRFGVINFTHRTILPATNNIERIHIKEIGFSCFPGMYSIVFRPKDVVVQVQYTTGAVFVEPEHKDYGIHHAANLEKLRQALANKMMVTTISSMNSGLAKLIFNIETTNLQSDADFPLDPSTLPYLNVPCAACIGSNDCSLFITRQVVCKHVLMGIEKYPDSKIPQYLSSGIQELDKSDMGFLRDLYGNKLFQTVLHTVKQNKSRAGCTFIMEHIKNVMNPTAGNLSVVGKRPTRPTSDHNKYKHSALRNLKRYIASRTGRNCICRNVSFSISARKSTGHKDEQLPCVYCDKFFTNSTEFHLSSTRRRRNSVIQTASSSNKKSTLHKDDIVPRVDYGKSIKVNLGSRCDQPATATVVEQSTEASTSHADNNVVKPPAEVQSTLQSPTSSNEDLIVTCEPIML